MKKRHLRPVIEKILFTITMLLFMFVCMVNDMKMSFIPIYLAAIIIVAVNIIILSKYGKGVYLDGER